MRKLIPALSLAFATLLGTDAGAQGSGRDGAHPVVIELFTSQGCSSCPPADEMLRELATRSDVIALALHVDYWDYIGWKDVFASPVFTRRQQQYALAAGERAVYTPQLIIGGQDHVIGAKPMEVMDFLAAHAGLDHGIALTLQRTGAVLSVRATARQMPEAPVLVQLVRYTPQETVEIKRGENAGRTVDYANIVTSWEVLGEWSGAEPLSLEADVPGDAPAVVILQKAGPGLILAAGEVR